VTFLTDDEVKHLTGKTRWSAQVRALVAMGVAFERRAAWQACLKVRPRHFPRLLFLTRDGNGYVAADGTTSGFDSQWQRFMEKVVAAGVPRFTEHDLRAKVASDSPDIETARGRLGHTSATTTRNIYHRKDEVAE